ncbi:hypothetical protein FA09DRAFT_329748 [Tilletiopsis washingtonensis]|uniref:Uncharacterized protein n=1 Tax=Tilletiopsis washingtonensis TaxID=58919 RepID=A0A316ZAS2_9BASI|nr:hypothetical protein FA09DRAFT_329748 [Tilletiopsis washingtonensis]PWN98118.1 hypothetical protein FA09DRAFT_329748 [Tilletiopsis washingtonensis]
MAGPNVELFKFGLYLFFPLAIMIHVGDPDWYERHVRPIRDSFWPSPDTLYVPPRDQASIKSELERLRAERRAKAAQAIAEAKREPRSSSSSSSPSSFSSSSSSTTAPSPAQPARTTAPAHASATGASDSLLRLGPLIREASLRNGLTPPAGLAAERESETQRRARREAWAAQSRGRAV